MATEASLLATVSTTVDGLTDGEDMCAVDYVRMVLLNNFRGKTDVERLENLIKRIASPDIKAVLKCTGGLRPFLEMNGQVFSLDSVSVSVNEGCRPSKESDVIKWIRGRLKTSPRKIFSIPSLKSIVEKGPQGIRVYFAVTCPTMDKLREWFLQRTQLFKQTPSGNIYICELPLPLSGSSPLWSTVDFFVKILDEPGVESLSVDWSCLFNYVFVAENTAIVEYVMASYDESTFEQFFRTYAEQFGLELTDADGGQLRRCADLANSGMQSTAISYLTDESTNNDAGHSNGAVVNDTPLAQSVELCKRLFNGRRTLTVAEMQRLFHDEAPRSLLNFIQRNYPAERFVDILAENDTVFVLSDNRQKVQLRESLSLWSAVNRQSSSRPDVKKNPKLDKTLVKYFSELLTMAAQEQDVHQVDVEKLCNCVQLLSKNLISYTIQTYRPPSQLFEGHDVFRLNKDKTVVSLKKKIAHSSEYDPTAEATLSVNFLIDALRLLNEYNVRFVQPTQLDLLTCLMNPAAQSYIKTSFKKGQLKILLQRFPAIFCESKTGNVYLNEKMTRGLKLDPSNEVITKIKAICTNVTEGSAIEFFLYEIEARKAYCYPVPVSWCSCALAKASRSVNSYISEYFPAGNLADFLIKFPAVFKLVPQLDVVYLRKEEDEGWSNNNHNNANQERNNRSNCENGLSDRIDEQELQQNKLILGLVAALCLAKCEAIATNNILELTKRCHIAGEVDALLVGEEGKNRPERLIALLGRFPRLVQLEPNTDKVAIQWPAAYLQQLESAMKFTLSRIVRNIVTHMSDEQGCVPTTMAVFESVQHACVGGLFPLHLRTLTAFLEVLEEFPAVFATNGSANTIAVKGYRFKSKVLQPDTVSPASFRQTASYDCPPSRTESVFTTTAASNIYCNGNGGNINDTTRRPHLATFSPAGVSAPQSDQSLFTSPLTYYVPAGVDGGYRRVSPTEHVEPLRQWVDEKAAVLRTWTDLGGLLGKFVAHMDIETMTKFAGLQSLVDSLASCVDEVERICSFGGSPQAYKLVELYDSSSEVFFKDFAPIASKIARCVVEGRHCQRPSCGCRSPTDVPTFETFMYLCQSVRIHLDEGPLPRLLTPSSSSSNSSTPDILQRLCTWSENAFVLPSTAHDAPWATATTTTATAEDALPRYAGPADIPRAFSDERSYKELTARLVSAAQEELAFESVTAASTTTTATTSTPSAHLTSSCWPRSIWEPEPGELNPSTSSSRGIATGVVVVDDNGGTSHGRPPPRHLAAVPSSNSCSRPPAWLEDNSFSSTSSSSASSSYSLPQSLFSVRSPPPGLQAPPSQRTYRVTVVDKGGQVQAEADDGTRLAIDWGSAGGGVACGDHFVVAVQRRHKNNNNNSNNNESSSSSLSK